MDNEDRQNEDEEEAEEGRTLKRQKPILHPHEDLKTTFNILNLQCSDYLLKMKKSSIASVTAGLID